MAISSNPPLANGDKIPHRVVPVDYTNAQRERPVDPAYHPPFFAVTFANLLSDTYNCQFELTDTERHKSTPLPEYIETIVQSTKLPFQVTVAALILLQRLYTHLPPIAYKRRNHLSPYQLFTGAYITAAKQYTQLRLGLDVTHLVTRPEEQAFEEDGTTPALVMSSEYWAWLTAYTVAQVKEMQLQFLISLGGSICVFPVQSSKSQEFLKTLKPFPIRRNLPPHSKRYHSLRDNSSSRKAGILRKGRSVQAFGRMTAEEQLDHFVELGRRHNTLNTATSQGTLC